MYLYVLLIVRVANIFQFSYNLNKGVAPPSIKERKKIMDLKIELPKSVDNAFQNLTDKPTKNIGTLIQDALYLRFGSISYNAEKRRILEKHGLIEFENRLKECIDQIPIEKLVEPDFQSLMLAVDNLEPCISSECLRNLFANLISRSCNRNYKEFIHPSFSEILRQMSPFDAKILKFYVENKLSRFITYTYKSADGYLFDRVSYMFDSYPYPDESDFVSIAISSLIRLGILAVHNDSYIHSAGDTPFQNSQFYIKCEQDRIKEGEYQSSSVTAQVSIITPFGKAFIHSCFD